MNIENTEILNIFESMGIFAIIIFVFLQLVYSFKSGREEEIREVTKINYPCIKSINHLTCEHTGHASCC